MTRGNYSQIETGKRKDVIDPEKAVKLCRLLEIDMLDLVIAMGYTVKTAGPTSRRAQAVAQAFDAASPTVQEHIARGLGVET